MFPLSADPIDGFFALFGEGSVILDKKSMPLGASTVEVLNLDDRGDLSALDNAVRKLEPELLMLLSGPDATSAALADAALDEFWGILRQYPVYRHLEHQSETLPNSVRENPALLEAMLTPGTEDNASMKDWFHHLRDLSKSFQRFQNHAVALLERAFTDLSERSASAYARQINGYYLMLNLESQVMAEEIDELDGEEFRCTRTELLQEMERRNFPESFQIRVSYRSVPHPKKEGKYLLAEQVMFQDVETFLSLDLLRGLAAGHLPRRCENCGKWFLLTSGFDCKFRFRKSTCTEKQVQCHGERGPLSRAGSPESYWTGSRTLYPQRKPWVQSARCYRFPSFSGSPSPPNSASRSSRVKESYHSFSSLSNRRAEIKSIGNPPDQA